MDAIADLWFPHPFISLPLISSSKLNFLSFNWFSLNNFFHLDSSIGSFSFWISPWFSHKRMPSLLKWLVVLRENIRYIHVNLQPLCISLGLFEVQRQSVFTFKPLISFSTMSVYLCLDYHLCFTSRRHTVSYCGHVYMAIFSSNRTTFRESTVI